jgi:hypothetical protein
MTTDSTKTDAMKPLDKAVATQWGAMVKHLADELKARRESDTSLHKLVTRVTPKDPDAPAIAVRGTDADVVTGWPSGTSAHRPLTRPVWRVRSVFSLDADGLDGHWKPQLEAALDGALVAEAHIVLLGVDGHAGLATSAPSLPKADLWSKVKRAHEPAVLATATVWKDLDATPVDSSKKLSDLCMRIDLPGNDDRRFLVDARSSTKPIDLVLAEDWHLVRDDDTEKTDQTPRKANIAIEARLSLRTHEGVEVHEISRT